MKYDDDQLERAIALYKSGVKVTKITEETGVPRPALYHHLQRVGLEPSRTREALRGTRRTQVRKDEAADAFAYAMQKVEEQAVEIARLRDLLVQSGVDPNA